MGHRLDRIMYETSVVYIGLPVFIFFAGWLRPLAAVPVCAVFLISIFMMLKNRPEPLELHISRRQWGTVLISLLLLALWVFLSGQGGFAFQNSDFHYRNAIFHDLIEKSWPVIYHYRAGGSIAAASETSVLTYYIAYWLPGAVVGKLFGWYAANTFQYFWTLLGLALVTYYLFRTLRRVSVRSVLILIFFSGLDLAGYLLLSKGVFPGLTDHIEWWSGLQYSSNTTLLFWVFNQTVTIWLAILLILNLKNSRSLFFLYAMLLLHGPFPFLGMLPIVLWKAWQGYPLSGCLKTGKGILRIKGFIFWFWNGVRRALTFENLAGGISVLLIIYLYLRNNVSGGTAGMNTWSSKTTLLVILEGGIYLLLLFFNHHRSPLYWICLASILIIPLFKVGSSQDFCMRVSIPALFMIQILVQKTLLGREEPDSSSVNNAVRASGRPRAPAANQRGASGLSDLTGAERRMIKGILVVLLVIGAAVPVQEISRSVAYTLPSYRVTRSAMVSAGKALADADNSAIADIGKSLLTQSNYGLTWADSIQTLEADKTTSANFIGPTEDNFFYTYLARQ